MSYYDWQNIFKNKTEKELLKIYSGDSGLNYEAEIHAGLELKNRDFDFATVAQIHNRKVEELKSDISLNENL